MQPLFRLTSFVPGREMGKDISKTLSAKRRAAAQEREETASEKGEGLGSFVGP